MDSIYVLIPVTFVLLGIAVAAWLWSVSSGQLEDLDKAASSILFEEDAPQQVDTKDESTAPRNESR